MQISCATAKSSAPLVALNAKELKVPESPRCALPTTPAQWERRAGTEQLRLHLLEVGRRSNCAAGGRSGCASWAGMGLSRWWVLGNRAVSVLIREAAFEFAAARPRPEGGGGWARGGTSSFSSSAAAMAPIKVTADPAGPNPIPYLAKVELPLSSLRVSPLTCPPNPSPPPSRPSRLSLSPTQQDPWAASRFSPTLGTSHPRSHPLCDTQ
jgi:hypothetical protein